MKKVKELLCFLIAIAVLWLLPLAFILYVDLADGPAFVGLKNYIRLFLNDSIFVTALCNTYLMALLFGVASVAVFSLMVYLLRKKVKIKRTVYFLSSAVLGSVGSLIGNVGLKVASLAASEGITDAADTLLSHIGDYSAIRPGVAQLITVTDVLIALQVGVLVAFLFWIAERIVSRMAK